MPILHPVTAECMGALQVTNKLSDEPSSPFSPFSHEDQSVLQIAADQLSEQLHGRIDVFEHAGEIGDGKVRVGFDW